MSTLTKHPTPQSADAQPEGHVEDRDAGEFDERHWHNRHKRRPPRFGEEEEGEGPEARVEWFLSSRTDREGKPLRRVFLEASRRRHQLEEELRKAAGTASPAGTPGPAGSVNWTPLGPSAISSGLVESGRVTCLAAGPGGTRVYVGAANGGVWFSSDGGASWAPLDDYTVSPSLYGGAAEADSLSIGALGVRFGASAIADEIYVGTGEPNHNYDAYLGIGIRHLVAGTWTLEATNLASRGIHAIVIDPNDSTHVLAATTSGLYRRPTSGSVATWTQVTSASFANNNGEVSDLIVAGTGASKTWYAAFYNDKVYRSADGVTWTAITSLSGTGRIALAAGESDPTAVYALVSDGTLNRLNGTSFSAVPGLPASVLFADPPSGQGWYDIAIAVDPTNGNTVYLCGDAYAVFKGTLTGSAGAWTFPFNAANTGTPWVDPTWVGSGIHADVHAIGFTLNAAGTAHDATTVWVGSDGGAFRSTGSGGAGTFQSRNLGLAITEFAYLAHRGDTDAVVFAGAQDNGTPRLLSEQAAKDTAGGDGGGLAYDPTNAYNVLRQYVRASLNVTKNGGASWTGVNFPPVTAATAAQQNAAGTENNSTGFVAPLASVASGASGLAAFGTNRLWLTSDWGTSWVTLPTATNPYSPATPDLTQDVMGGAVRSIAFASATRIFAATPNVIWRYDTTTNWASATKTVIPTTGLPAFSFITAIAPEDPATGTFYVTLGGGGVAHLYYWNGTTWTAAMPTTVVDVPTHAAVVDPNNTNIVYVGTDVGVFKGIKSGTTWSWSPFWFGMPEAAVVHLAIHSGARLLRAATHGRGVWEIDIDATSAADVDLYLRVNYNDTGRMKAGARQAWVEGHLDPTHVDAVNPYVLYHWMSADIKVRRSSLSGLPALSSPVDFVDFAVNIGDYVDSTQHIETADVSGIDRIFVEVHNRTLNPLPAGQVRVLLLATDASAGLPALPAGYGAQINAGNTSSAWLGTNWRFVDTASPYRVPTRDLDVRTPQVVEYQLDFSTLGLPAGHQHVCLAAFVTTTSDPITGTTTSLDQLTMSDKHVAHRNTHLVALGTKPGTEPGGDTSSTATMLLDFHNPTDKMVRADLVFDRAHFPGHLSLMLPALRELAKPKDVLDGFTIMTHDTIEDDVRHTLSRWIARVGEVLEEAGEWLERAAGEEDRDRDDDDEAKLPKRIVRKLARLDRSRVLVADTNIGIATVKEVRIPAHGMITTAITVRAPSDAKPGDSFRLHAMQRQHGRIVGGSTYIIAIPRPKR